MNVLWGGGGPTVYFPKTCRTEPTYRERDYNDLDSNRFHLTRPMKSCARPLRARSCFIRRSTPTPVHPDPSGASSIVGSHTLIPDALYHAFSTFGALMSPDLPLERAAARDDRDHGLGDQPVRVLNRVARRVSA